MAVLARAFLSDSGDKLMNADNYKISKLPYIENGGYRTKRVGFIGDGASKLLLPSPF